MGKSSSISCFKIITCGSDSKDQDEIIDVIESKDSRDKRGWSFRKRSSQQHRVLNNTVITAETPSVEKENHETSVIDFHQPAADSFIPEKINVVHFTNEETRVSNVESIKGSDVVDVVSKIESKVDGQVEESIVIVIQTCIRGILARRELLKVKNVVKLQAAVRGLLVRRHAAGTIRCVQAIVKMQTLVRSRRAQLSLEGSATEEKHEKENPGSKITVKGDLTKSNFRYISIDKLLSNNFARQLLESTPRNKPINIKCEPSKHDSAWKWLERWMAVSSLDSLETKKAESVTSEELEKENEESHVEDVIDSKALSETEDLSFSTTKSVLPSESEDLTTDADNFQFQSCHSPSLSVSDNLEHPWPENASKSEVKETSIEVLSVPDQKTQLDAGLQTELNSLSEKPEVDIEQVNPLKRIAPEQLETDGKKIALGSRKGLNPSFIIAQAKFEQLSLAPDTIETTSMHQDIGVEPDETVSSTVDTVPRMKESSAAEDFILPGSRATQVGGSECDTELSISSTLDSPNESEAGGLAGVHIDDVSKKGVQDPSSDLNMDVEAKDASIIPVQNDFQVLVDDHPEKTGDSNSHSITSVAVMDSAPSEAKPERTSDLQGELDADMGRQARSSPEASPRSHLTVPESQGTPSSQVSVKSKRDKTDKTGSYQKQKSSPAGKKSPSNPNRNSGSRASMEHFHKDQKNGKRRNSFDAARPENTEGELRDSSSNSSLPHFMQATESARAKLQSTNSPRSSPDVQDREIYIKKRHSLPADGRQGSPRVEQAISRAQQGAKGNEKMWRR